MLTIRKLVVCAIALLAMFVQVAGQDNKSSEQYVEVKGFVGKVIQVKNREPREIYQAIRPLLSGFKGATMSYSDEFNTITVRDWPENVATIEEAIKRLDVPKQPEPPKPSVEFRVDMITGSKLPSAGSAFTGDLAKVVDQLKTFLGFSSYRLVSTFVASGKDGSNIETSGILDGLLPSTDSKPAQPSFYNISSARVSMQQDASGQVTLEVPDFRFSIRVPIITGASVGGTPTLQYQDVGIRNGITLKEGEHVVVGTTSAGSTSDAIIIVVSFVRRR